MFFYSQITLKRQNIQSQKCSKKKKKKTKQKDANKTNDSNIMDEESEITELLHLINGSLHLETSCLSSKAARSLAYRLLFMQKIKDFCETDDSLKELNFHAVLNTKQRTYIQGVVANINKKEVKNVYNSYLENNLFKKIKKISNWCYMNVVFSGQ